MKWKHRLEESCALSLTLLWVYTATDKLFRMELFRFRLDAFPGLRPFAGALAWGLPLLELAIAGLLLTWRTRRQGLYASMGVLVLFTAYLAVMLDKERHLPCTCGGVIELLSWKQHILFNAFFIAVAATAVYCRRNKFISSPKRQLYET